MRRVTLSVIGTLLLTGCGGSSSPTSPSPASAPVSTAQRDYLVALYKSTNGPGWFDKTNWTDATPYTPDTDPCGERRWFGVTCSGGAVIGIELPSNQLNGVLPEFTGMSSLQTFDVGPRAPTNTNQLRGQIPSLSRLTALRVFRGRSQQFDGPIPSLAGLTALQEIDVANNSLLSGPLPSLNGLAALRVFRADSTLTGPVPSLSGLVALQEFTLQANNRRPTLTGSIPSISGLTALRIFEVSADGLSGPIPSLSGLTLLQRFDVGGRDVSGPLPELSGLPALEVLNVSGRLSGPIPSLSGLSALRSVVLCCGLSGPIPSLAGLGALIDFDVENNQLSGALPSPPPPVSGRVFRAYLCGNFLRSTGDPTVDGAWDEVVWVRTGLGNLLHPTGGWLACQRR